MHHTLGDLVVQREWLFAQVTEEDERENHRPGPLISVIAMAKHEHIRLEEADDQHQGYWVALNHLALKRDQRLKRESSSPHSRAHSA